MTPRWHQPLHRPSRALGWAVGVSVIALAVLVALGQLLLPLLARHPQWVAAQLSERLQQPVSFTSMEGRWQGSGPLFVMRDVTIGMGKDGQVLRLPESELKLDFGGWLLPSRHLLNLRVRGLQLNLSHDADGRWHVNGLSVAGEGNQQSVSLGPLSMELWLKDLHLEITDTAVGRHYSLVADQLRLSRQGSQIRVGVAMRRDGAAGAWHGAGRFLEDGSAGRLWLAGDDVDLHALAGDVAMGSYTAERGHGSVAAWLDWEHGRIVHGTARINLDDLVIGRVGGRISVPTLHGLVALTRGADGYGLRWVSSNGGALVAALHRPGTPDMRLEAAARNLPLDPLLPWLALEPGMSPGLVKWLGGGRPHGMLDHAAVRWGKANGLESLDVGFSQLGIDAVGKLPGVSSLSGELRGDAEAFSLTLPTQASVLRFPHTFRKPFAMAKLAGDVAFWPADDAWHIGTDGFDFTGEGFAGQVRGEVALPKAGGRPFMDLYARIDRADVQAAKLFWPLGSMSPATIDWLDRALVAGTIDSGTVLVHGSLADWPFRHNEGRFEARATLSGLTLDYGKDWPPVVGIDAVASFVDNGMLVEAHGGQALGTKVGQAVALIPDFADSTLDLNVEGSGSGASLMDFVRKSPIGSRQADALSKLSLGGNGSFNFHLSLPLRDVSALTLNGSGQLTNADLSAPAWKLKLDKLSGPLQFDAQGLHAGPMDGGFRGQPSKFELTIGDATGSPDTVLAAHLDGSYTVAELVQDHPALSWLGDAAQGRSQFAIGFDIANGGSGPTRQTLSIDSSLQGVALDFPVPLNKSAAAALPLHMTLPLPVASSDLRVELGQVLRARIRLPNDDVQPLAATLAFGDSMPQSLPDKGLRIRGSAGQMDVFGWVQRSVAGSGADSPSLESIDVHTDHADIFGRDFSTMHIQATPQADGLGIDVDGPALAGHFSVPAQDLGKRGITARLQRLYWPKENPPPAQPAATPAAPVATGSAGKRAATAAPAVAASNPAATGIAPSALPPFHLWIGDLRLGDAKLGEARLETWPTAQGMHIDQMRALSPRVQINATGDWNGTAENSRTHLRMDFAAEDLGSMLNALGFEGLFDGGKTRAQLDASWPGAPSTLALANMDGKLSVNVSHGRIPEVGPGVGRLFGLVSVAELPRRLTLDFGDVFGKGLAFDSITGDFHLADGNARTDNLKIRGPAAEISIRGRTGLRAKDYDQQVLVVPHVGGSLPIVGAVVAGPVGAAAGLAVQGLLGRGLNKAASARYSITGSWDKPTITLLEKKVVPVTAPLAEPSLSAPAPAASGAAPAATQDGKR